MKQIVTDGSLMSAEQPALEQRSDPMDRASKSRFVCGDDAVVMTNGDAGDELVRQIFATIAQEYDWPDFRPPVR